MLDPGKHVKLFFKNGLVEEGIIVSWSDKQSVIKALTSDNLLVIQNSSDDIIAIKVFVYPLLDGENSQPVVPLPQKREPVYIDKELELPGPERNLNVRALKLAELRQLRAHEEQENARKLMTTFTNSGNFSLSQQTEHYGIPRRPLQKPPRIHSAEKTRTRNPHRD